MGQYYCKNCGMPISVYNGIPPTRTNCRGFLLSPKLKNKICKERGLKFNIYHDWRLILFPCLKMSNKPIKRIIH